LQPIENEFLFSFDILNASGLPNYTFQVFRTLDLSPWPAIIRMADKLELHNMFTIYSIILRRVRSAAFDHQDNCSFVIMTCFSDHWGS